MCVDEHAYIINSTVKIAYTECFEFPHTSEGGFAVWDQVTSSYVIGWLLGLAAGIGIGISIGVKRKPASELTDSEKRRRKVAITTGVVFWVVGVLFLFIRLMSRSL